MQTFVCLVSVIKENYGIDRSIVLALSGLGGVGGIAWKAENINYSLIYSSLR
jgi:hypothetical protein